MQEIEVNGVIHEFPDGMSDADIAAILRAEYSPQPVDRIYSDVPTLGPMPKVQQRPPAPMPERIAGGLEAATTMLTGATGGTLGYMGGAVGGLAEQLAWAARGQGWNPDAVEQRAMQGAAGMTYMPRSPMGQQYTRDVGEALGQVPPFLGVAPALYGDIVRPRVQAYRGLVAGRRAAENPALTQPGLRSVGASQLSPEDVRVVTAETMPVPFADDAALTAGQRTRDFSQLQFERESSKMGDLGEPLRQRFDEQNERLALNKDFLVEHLEPSTTEPLEVGLNIDRALQSRKAAYENRLRALYKQAEEAGDVAAPVDLAPMSEVFDTLFPMEGVAPNIKAVRAEAQRLGLLDADGNWANAVPVNNLETLRQFVNAVTDMQDGREKVARGKIISAIDGITEGVGGNVYKRYRKLRTQFGNEYERASLVNALTSTKKNSTERAVALDKAFEKVFVQSSMEELNKLRASLLRAGKDGRQAWQDVKATGVEYIWGRATGGQKDARGNPIVLPARFEQVVKRLDKEGKLDAIYGKKQAQLIRDMQELSWVMMTAPPGAINHSNTASAMAVILDMSASNMVLGLPAPAATAVRQLLRFTNNTRLKHRINQALRGKSQTRRGAR